MAQLIQHREIVVDAGETEFTFSFSGLKYDMQPVGYPFLDELSGNLGVAGLVAQYLRDSGKMLELAIGQPDNPKYAKNYKISERAKNKTDRTTVFYSDSISIIEHLRTQRQAPDYSEEEHDLIRKWKIGVGAGVGVGVPIVAAAMFVAGWWFRQKKVSKIKSAD